MTAMIYTRRAYDVENELKGERFLVDRIWPRGLKKDEIKAVWLRDAAPSDALRQRFHAGEEWESFKKSYFDELDSGAPAWMSIVEAAGRGDVILLYSSRDTEHNNATALKEYIENQLKYQSASQ